MRPRFLFYSLLVLLVAGLAWLGWQGGAWDGAVQEGGAAVDGSVAAPAFGWVEEPADVDAEASETSETEMARPADRLLKTAVLLEEHHDAPDTEGRVRTARLWRTEFKYPLILEERWQGPAGAAPSEERRLSVADHVLVRFPETMDEKAVRRWTEARGFILRRRLQTTPVYVVAARQASLTAAAEILQAAAEAFPQAVVAERDWVVSAMETTVTPNDGGFAQSWGLHNSGQNGGTADADIDAPEAWAYGTGSRAVKVAVIDSGIDYQHPDLAANMWTNEGEIPANGKDDDRNGYVDDVRGWDFHWNQNDPRDHNDHGTHCAGIIGAVGHNGKGIAGVNWQVSLMPLRFLDYEGNGATSDAIEAVNYATKMGADVMSNSWGGGAYSSLLRDAIDQAGKAGILFVAAAGNNNPDLTYYSSYPGSFSLPNIVSVAASTAKDERASFSNYGPSAHLSAPGAEIYSTVRNNKYALKDGTSMAAPHVAGALALARSMAPELTAAQLKERLLGSVDRVAALEKTATGGRLNLARFIEHCHGHLPVVTTLTVREAEGANGDGILNPGEPLVVSFGLENRGLETVVGLRATLSSRKHGTMFSLTENVFEVGDLAGGEKIAAADRFTMTSRADAPTPLAEEFLITLSFTDQEDEMVRSFMVRLEHSARVSGRIFAEAGGAALPDGVVRYSGTRQGQVLPDAEGRYDVVLPDGQYRLSASAPGYLTAETEVQLPPERMDMDFALRLPQLKVTPLEVIAEAAAGAVVQRTVTLENRGTSPLPWNLHLRAGNRLPVDTVLEGFSLAGVSDVDGGEGGLAVESQEVGALSAALGRLHGVRIAVMGAEADRSVLLEDLRLRGAVIVPLSADFDLAAVQGAAMFVVDDSIRMLSAEQIALLRERVKAGAGLLCEADDATSMSAVNTLFEDTGVSAYAITSLGQTYTTISTHALTNGVKKLVEVGVGAIALLGPPAQPLVMHSTTQAHAAVTPLGLGTMIFVGNELTHTANFSSGDARLFANRIFDECAGTVTWLTAPATSGTLAPGATVEVTLEFDARLLLDGAYDATAFFAAGDADEPQTIVPIRLQVNGAPEVQLSRNEIDFGVNYTHEYDYYGETLMIQNVGTKMLRINAITIEGADAKEFSRGSESALIAPSQALNLNMRFWGSEIRSYSAELVLETDDVDEARLVVPITASRAVGGSIAMPSRTVALTLKQGTKGTVTFSFNNRGPGVLPWTARARTNFGGGWSSVDISSGALAPKGVQKLKVTADATGLEPDSAYMAYLDISCVDPRTSGMSGIVKLKVLPAALIQIAQTDLVFPDTFVKGTSTVRLGISNLGKANLTISSIKSSSKVFAAGQALPLVVPPGGFRELALAFKPTATGTFASEIRLNTNAVTQPPAVAVSGTAIGAPVLSVTPTKLPVLTVAADSTAAHTLEIRNAGSATLEWAAADGGGRPALAVAMANLQRNPGRIVEAIPDLEKNSAANKLLDLSIFAGQSTSTVSIGPTPGKITPHSFFGAGGRYFTIETLPGMMAWVADCNRTAGWQVTCGWFGEGTEDRSAMGTRLVYQRNGRTYQAFVRSLGGREMPSLNDMVICEGGTPAQIDFRTNYNKVSGIPGKGRVHYLRFARTKDTLLSEAQWQRIFESYIDVVDSTTPWLVVTPNQGRLEADESEQAQVTLDSTGLPAGTYSGTVVVTGNDPMKPAVKIPLTMRVTAGPMLACEPGAVHFPKAWTGRPVEMLLLLRNSGSQALKIDRIESSVPWLTVDSPAKTLAAGAALAAKLRLDAQASGHFETALKILSNSSDGAELMVPVSADAYDEPILTVQPESFTRTVLPSGSLNEKIHLTNSGGTPLEWRAEVIESRSLMNLDVTEGIIQPGETGGPTLLFTSGRIGMSSSGAIRIKSNAPARPITEVYFGINVPWAAYLQAAPVKFPDAFVAASVTAPWILRNVGSQPLTVTGITSSDATCSLPGIVYPFTIAAGTEKTVQVRFAPVQGGHASGTLKVASNSFNSPITEIGFSGEGVAGPVVTLGGPPAAVTLDPGATTTAAMTITNSGLVPLTWNAVVKRVSKGGSTYVTDIVQVLAPAEGTLEGGMSSTLQIDLHPPAELGSGLYTYTIEVTSNDAQRPVVTVDANFTVRHVPRLTITPAEVVFPDTFAHGKSTLELTLGDGGNGAFNVTGITSTAAECTVTSERMPLVMRDLYSWGAWPPKKIQVHFAPTQAGEITGHLQFATNIPGMPVMTVPVRGRGIAEPKLLVNPQRIDAALQPGQTSDHEITIANPGSGGPLNWQAELVSDDPRPPGQHPDLGEVLARFDAAAADIARLLPALHDFSAGIREDCIKDEAMYESTYTTGNMMLDPGGYYDQTPLPYSDGRVREHAYVGSRGRYFTRHRSQMFLMAADLDRVSKFYTQGSFATNGWVYEGLYSVHGMELSREVRGVRFSGFFKQALNITRASVNHLIITEETPGLAQHFKVENPGDDHEVTGLPARSRVYYLMFATKPGTGMLPAATVWRLMDAFVDQVTSDEHRTWAELAPRAGSTEAGGSDGMTLRLHARPDLEVGAHELKVRLTSNAPANGGTLEVPVTLTVQPRALEATPRRFEQEVLEGVPAAPQTLAIRVREGEIATWAVDSDVPWLTVSQPTGTGSTDVTLTYGVLPLGSHIGRVTITTGTLIQTVHVQVAVRPHAPTQLLTDHHRGRILGIDRGIYSFSPSYLTVVTELGKVAGAVALPPDITDADISSDGDTLYAISGRERSITRVDLRSLKVLDQRALPPVTDEVTDSTVVRRVQAGRPGVIYYTDLQSKPRLHVFDYAGGVDQSVYAEPKISAIGGLLMAPDDRTLYAVAVLNGYNRVVKLDASAPALILTASSTTPQGFDTSRINAPFQLLAGGQELIYENARFRTSDLAGRERHPYHPIAFSSYGDVYVYNSAFYRAENGVKITGFDLPAIVSTAPTYIKLGTFTADQKRFVYFNNIDKRLESLDLSGMNPPLPATGTLPDAADGAVLTALPETLTWQDDAVSQGYAVYLGTDPGAVAAADPESPGLYLGTAMAGATGMAVPGLALGQTYYWRVDSLRSGGVTVAGPVWSFRTSAVSAFPLEIGRVIFNDSVRSDKTATITITTATPNTAWTVSATQPGITLSPTSGTGPGTVTVTLKMTTNLNAAIQVQSGADACTVAVKTQVLWSLASITKLIADRELSWIYGLNSSYLLWINPTTAEMEFATLLPAGVKDMTVHEMDDRIYVLTSVPDYLTNKVKLHQVERQGLRRVLSQPPPQEMFYATESIYAAGSRGVLTNMSYSSFGNETGMVADSLTGSSFLAALDWGGKPKLQATQYVPLQGYVSRELSFAKPAAAVSAAMVGSADRTRVFYKRTAIRTTDLQILRSGYAEDVVAASPDGSLAVGERAVYQTSTGVSLLDLPVSAKVAAVAPDGQTAVQYDAAAKRLVATPLMALATSPMAADFGQTVPGATSSRVFELTNHSPLDVTVVMSSTHAAFRGPADPITLNAGSSAQVTVHFTPSEPGACQGSLSFAAIGHASLTKTVSVSGTGVLVPALTTLNFGVSAPSSTGIKSLGVYREGGFDVTRDRFNGRGAFDQVGSNVAGRPNNGTPYVAAGYYLGGEVMRLVRTDGGQFSPRSVRLAEYGTPATGTGRITFRGMQAGGATVGVTFALDMIGDGAGAAVDFETFTFPASFHNLVSVDVEVEANGGYSMDDLTVEMVPEAPVSAPDAEVTAHAEEAQSPASLMMDANGDGTPETEGLTIAAVAEGEDGERVYTCVYTRPTGAAQAAHAIQASRDGETWVTLTPALDYTETIQSIDSGEVERVTLSIPAASRVPWKFRVIVTP